MKDVTHKTDSLREASACSRVEFPEEIGALVREARTEKGDVLTVARIAGIMAAKRTPELIPLCHPIPITGADVELTLEPGAIAIEATVRTLAPTGVEMEALTAATIAALTVYDMLKPHTTELRIGTIRLERKTGGKSSFRRPVGPPPRAAILVASDSVAQGDKADRAGPAVAESLRAHGVVCGEPVVLPDDRAALRREAERVIADGADLLVAVGGTGAGPRDVTVEALSPLIDRLLPGVMEAARAHGQRRTRLAMLSRGVAGLAGSTIVVTLPGSTRGAVESCHVLFPPLLHVLDVLRERPHESDDR